MTEHAAAEQFETPLNEQTRKAVEEFIASLTPEAQAIVGASFEKLLKSDVGEHARAVGDAAPDFGLPSVKGGETRLSDLLRNGPVVLNFYRGGWCPFCNLEFRALNQRLPEIQSLGATLIGVSPETPDNSLTTAEKHALEFEVLSDVGNIVARDYGLLTSVSEEMRPLYTEWGIDVPAVNGDDSHELPVPATYVIDTHGIIRASYVNKDYTTRMEPSDIVAALKAIVA